MEIRVKRVMLTDYDSTDELYHWGIKGMKWGVRRYQNKDGSLTAAGRKRRSLGQYIHDKKVAKKRKEAAAKARETKAKNAAEKAKREKLLEKGKIPVKKMTDEELKRSMDRLKAEEEYQKKVRETSTWERFKYKAVNDMVIPALTESGKELAKSYLLKQGKNLLGLEEKKVKSAYDKLKEDADIAKLKKQKFQDERDLEVQTEKYKKYQEDQKKQKAQEKVDEYNAKKAKEDSVNDGLYKMKGDGTNKSVPTDIDGTPVNSNNQKKQKSNQTVSDIDTDTVNSGKTAVDKTLATPVPKNNDSDVQAGKLALNSLLALPAPKDDDK